MNSSSNLAIRIFLTTLGVILVLAAIILLLRGFGVISQIPGYVIWALVLIAVGTGILGGLRSSP
ncbi:hypothetical protein [Almyronema epifaneia]|uniref:DUF4175 domain-containing protein n=1 Tax=Almyronema epifaneia S1 TaxID=2991925 RepID=A0ABW6II70_9CYAN